jgi:hypothetical protein
MKRTGRGEESAIRIASMKETWLETSRTAPDAGMFFLPSTLIR